MNLERFKTTKKDLLRSAAYLIASGATIYGGVHLMESIDEYQQLNDDLKGLHKSLGNNDSTSRPTTDEEKKMYDDLIFRTPGRKLTQITANQESYLLSAHENNQDYQDAYRKTLLTLPILVPAILGAIKEFTTQKAEKELKGNHPHG